MGVFKKRNKWWISYYHNSKRVRRPVGASRKLAERVLRKIETDIVEGKFLDKRKDTKIKFNAFADTYLETHSKPHKRSYETDKSHIKHLKCAFGNMYLYEINAMIVEQYKIKRKEETSIVSINRQVSLLKHILNKAVEWDKISVNSMAKVKPYKEGNGRSKNLSEEEIKRLISNCNSYLQPIVKVAVNTGMRKKEILLLQWRDVDFYNNIINLYVTKNGDKREVPMNTTVQTTLKGIERNPDSPYVFCKPNGKPYTDVRGSYATALRKSGISGYVFHDLRHVYGARLARRDTSLYMIQTLLGHKSIRMTQRYACFAMDDMKKAVERLVA